MLRKFTRATKRFLRFPFPHQRKNPYGASTAIGDQSIYSQDAAPNYDKLRVVDAAGLSSSSDTDNYTLQSCLCTRSQLESPAFRTWTARMHEPWHLHRKLWEFCYIAQTLYERGLLSAGRRGLGFAVGEEPLPSLFASLGCEIIASDLAADDDRSQVWANTNQLATCLDHLNNRGICEQEQFRRNVRFRPVDMNQIPEDLTDFDFTWSSCSFEHCGSIELGKRFLREQLKCLKPGGIAVHTTEFNLTSCEKTIEEGTTVFFRRKDIEAIFCDLQAEGHTVELLQLDTGNTPEDEHVDIFPYSSNPHLKLLDSQDRFVTTSIGLIIRKAGVANASAISGAA
ncbi:class I SAM-dependent methyltransferase [Blastopirellula sp. J2-11]|uniref:class I SAM-dependent methyltransferase n=1 Tax=Blastopirellula sp. J2-11 TaxID=2943192 RepID=UPI0021C9AABC|nr:class I SAM-dependent methyltransferase [Blastopirellula sp. J2-11]UUO05494.1 class I SAM-dependent methyltransferase [Blastopirellula sp. J2-11]